MSNLSNKFDHLPQDFDREAIWNGIEKPMPLPLFQTQFGGVFAAASSGALFFVVALGIYLASGSVKSEDAPKAITTETAFALASPEAVSAPLEILSAPLFLLPEGVDQPAKKTETEKHAIRRSVPIESEGEGVGQVDRSDFGRTGREDAGNGQEPSAGEDLEGSAAPLPLLLSLLSSGTEKTLYVDQGEIRVRRSRAKQSLAIRGGIGRHHSRFDASEGEPSAWRSSLENPRMDYNLGLRYEYLFRRDFFLSLSASYFLFKDEINTSHTQGAIGQEVRVDYDLYNHYHLFSGQVEVGKRFFRKAFFWDVSGGVGVKFNQVSEVDYFVSEGVLASEAEVSSAYASATDVFFTAQAAIGRRLSHRLFARMGAQAHSGIDLTPSDAAIRHRLVPIHAFLEVGIWF